MLNIAEHNFRVIGYDLDESKRKTLLSEAGGLKITAADSISQLLAGLEKPRKIMLLVPAGPIVDKVISELRPHLENGDTVIDAGNS
ncbi:NAD(P)-binding domain-containing protein, partial [Escherichia coli]|nr:NAD(P)-binding domain-containing protein [Escherichia coli]